MVSKLTQAINSLHETAIQVAYDYELDKQDTIDKVFELGVSFGSSTYNEANRNTANGQRVEKYLSALADFRFCSIELPTDSFCDIIEGTSSGEVVDLCDVTCQDMPELVLELQYIAIDPQNGDTSIEIVNASPCDLDAYQGILGCQCVKQVITCNNVIKQEGLVGYYLGSGTLGDSCDCPDGFLG